MTKQFRFIKVSILLMGLLLMFSKVSAQTTLNNGTRAVFIFDIAKYIDYGPGFADSSVFRIGILDKDEYLFFEMGNLRKTRTKIQDKPVELVKFNSESQMPKYSVNEDLINKAGMKVNSNMMSQAIKTKEDWENLFGKASEQIVMQRDTIKQQLEMIDVQKAEILRQKAHLDSLNKEISLKEKTLNEKQKVLEKQYVQISKQQGEISVQKNTILAQQNAVQIQKDTLLSLIHI